MIKKYINVILMTAALFLTPCASAYAADFSPAVETSPDLRSSAQAATEDSPQTAARPFLRTSISSDTATAYQKLKAGSPVRIAILGDSIADKTGVTPRLAWNTLLYNWLHSEYASLVTLDNYAIGGSTSYTGYYQSETAMRKNIQKSGGYDLVIICYGQNDDTENFGLYYEGLLRSVKAQNKSCQMITILESSQQTYTEKMLEIIRLSGLYGADVADTISAFFLSGFTYEQLTPDGTHPNEAGHQLYFEVIRSVIEKNIAENKKAAQMPAASNPYAALFEDFTFIPLKKCKTSDGQYRLTAKAPALGIVYKKFPGGGDIRLEFSTGEVWEDTGDTAVLKKWTMASPVGLLVTPGSVITIKGDSDAVEDTVVGFISSGHLSVQPPG